MRPPNILFIPVDDLRPQLGCYGQRQMHTPHLDQLASQGTLFQHAYCQVPVCGASRASLLTGTRPNRQRFLDYLACVDQETPGALTMPQYFRERGYDSVSLGKIFHHTMDTAERSWTSTPWKPNSKASGQWRNYLTPEAIAVAQGSEHRGPPFECAEVPDNAYHDGQIADRAIAELTRLRTSDKPFFLAAGFLKPHLPFNAPKRYWDLYRAEELALADNPFAPEGAPEQAMHSFGELRHYFSVPAGGPLSEEMARQLVHGYYACTSYVDAQIGRVLRALDTLGLADSTIVVAWGDHGWQLGEHGLWCKHCNFNTSLNAPLIIRAPDQRGGGVSPAIVEFIDIFPTLCELSGGQQPEQLEGTSLRPLLENPVGSVKAAAFSRYGRGESLRTGSYLYTEWYDPADPERCQARMLYDHARDPAENLNLAARPDHAALVTRLATQLHAGPSR